MMTPTPRLFVLVVAILLSAAWWPSTATAAVTLAVLRPDSGDAKPVAIEVKQDIVLAPFAGKPHAGWVLQGGKTVNDSRRPPDRIIELYTGNGQSVLCRVAVRYFADGADWRPRLQLIDEPAVVATPDGWRPVALPSGAALVIAQTGGDLPNSQGYKATIRFGLVGSPVAIDAWQVR